MKRPLRVLIVDDEQLAREGLRAIVEAEPGVAAAVCADGAAAVERLDAGDVDVVFLDVQMPDLDGFEVLRRVRAALPVVVFVTAYDHFAVQAFDASATDYVVKPYADARIRAALARARRQVEQRQVGDARAALADLLAMAGGGIERRPADRIAVRAVGKVSFVRVADIMWIGAADYYAELHTRDGKAHLVRETMQRLESRLDPAVFARVHRTVIVRLDQVLEIRSVGTDRSAVVLRDGTRLPLSRSRREALEARLAEA
ncbi:MAG TPA: LytTR family DNA-binding domain-containing protein [Gemmatimonadaceae bacterium]|nr:LytTR family DNA-binding domain-containing protein [Gemmatimonadaceae bacterium]